MLDRWLFVVCVCGTLPLVACDGGGSSLTGDSSNTSSSSAATGGGGSITTPSGGAGQGGTGQGGAGQGGAGQGGAPPLKSPEQYDLGKSAGCGIDAATGLDKTLSVSIGGENRTYWRMVPDAYDKNEPHGLVVVLHGQWPDGQNVAYNGQKAAMTFFKSFPTPYLP